MRAVPRPPHRDVRQVAVERLGPAVERRDERAVAAVTDRVADGHWLRCTDCVLWRGGVGRGWSPIRSVRR